MRTVLVCVLLLCINSVGVSAQTPSPSLSTKTVYFAGDMPTDGTYGILPEQLFWMPDSRYLLFHPSPGEKMVFYAYDVQSGLRVPVERDPYTSRLTDTQMEHFRAHREDAYVDPRGRNFVYLSQFDTFLQFEGYGYWNLYAVGNFYHKTFLPLTLPNTFMLSGVTWSEDGSTFVIGANHYHGGLKSLIHIQRDAFCGETFCEFDVNQIAQVDGSETLFDLSADGNRVLIPRGGMDPALLLWGVEYEFDMSSRDYSPLIISRGNIIGAAFLPDNDDQILMVNEQGIVRYTLADSSSEVINPDINSTWASWVTFSPDNQWAAILKGDKVGREKLYVLPVEAAS